MQSLSLPKYIYTLLQNQNTFISPFSLLSNSAIANTCNSPINGCSPPSSSAYQFEVGDETGWIKPTGKERHSYNDWAAQNIFHIHDTLHFKYAKDSVMEVSSADYLTCNTSNPIAKFEDGSTVYELSRLGFLYFISGQPGHCKLGQRLIVRVMHPLQPHLPPASAPTGGRSLVRPRSYLLFPTLLLLL